MTKMGCDGIKAENGVSRKFHNELYPACPQECDGNYVKVTSISDASASEVLHTCSPVKGRARTGSPILYRVTLEKTGKKESFSDIVRV